MYHKMPTPLFVEVLHCLLTIEPVITRLNSFQHALEKVLAIPLRLVLNGARIWVAAKVSKFRRVLLEHLCSNSGRVGCRIVLLKFPKSAGMRNEHEWMQVIRQDA
ncbi:UNVERIFIED_CONTAM: hypothetical protein NCL1_34034 [Trichonephila clavipes]